MKPEDIKVGETYIDCHLGEVKVLSINTEDDCIYIDILDKDKAVNYQGTNIGYIFSLIMTAPDLSPLKTKKDPQPKMFGLFSVN